MTVDDILAELDVEKLKKHARNARLAYEELFNDYKLSHSMLQMVSRDASELARVYDTTMKRLKELDPDFPQEGFISLQARVQ